MGTCVVLTLSAGAWCGRGRCQRRPAMSAVARLQRRRRGVRGQPRTPRLRPRSRGQAAARAAAEAHQHDRQPDGQRDRPWWSEAGHALLDVGGLVPGLGERVDGINGVWFGVEGDWADAGLSLAGMVPFAAWGATGGKLAGKSVKAADDAGDAAKVDGNVAPPTRRPGTEWRRAGAGWHRDVQAGPLSVEGVPVTFVDSRTRGVACGARGWRGQGSRLTQWPGRG